MTESGVLAHAIGNQRNFFNWQSLRRQCM